MYRPSWESLQTPNWLQSERTRCRRNKCPAHISYGTSHPNPPINPHFAQSAKSLAFHWPKGHSIHYLDPPLLSLQWTLLLFSLWLMFSGHTVLHVFYSCKQIRVFALSVPSVWCLLSPDLQTALFLTSFKFLFKSHPLNDLYLNSSIKNYDKTWARVVNFLYPTKVFFL